MKRMHDFILDVGSAAGIDIQLSVTERTVMLYGGIMRSEDLMIFQMLPRTSGLTTGKELAPSL
jgi:hypothetical protein